MIYLFFYSFSPCFSLFFHILRYLALFFQCDKCKHIVAKAEIHCLDSVSSDHSDDGMASVHDPVYEGRWPLPGRTSSCYREISLYLLNCKGKFSGCPVHGCVEISSPYNMEYQVCIDAIITTNSVISR